MGAWTPMTDAQLQDQSIRRQRTHSITCLDLTALSLTYPIADAFFV
jgi:hypothetical protein